MAEWKQIRASTRKFQPQTITLKDSKGRKVPSGQVAEVMGEYHASNQWEEPAEEYVPREDAFNWPELDAAINNCFEEEEVLKSAKQLEKE